MPRIVEDVQTQSFQATNGVQPYLIENPSVNIPVVTVQTLHGKKKRAVVYESISVSGVVIPRANLKITLAMAKDMLGWETESEYQERMLKLGRITEKGQARLRPPNMEPTKKANKEEAARLNVKAGDLIPNPDWSVFAKAPEWHLMGPDGVNPVICWRNINNRPLDNGWVSQLSQDVITRCYLFNGENIIIGKTRLVISGQHRLIALIWACWAWYVAKNTPETERSADQKKWLEIWKEEPYIESLVCYGVEENQEVLMSIDNTKARTDADNFYTSELVEEILTSLGTNKASVRRQCSKMLQDSSRLLWSRMGAGGAIANYKTKQTTMAFAKSHPTILQCVRHIQSENSGSAGQPISDLGISAGQASAMMYLMGCCHTNGEAYRSKPERSEEGFDWSFLDKAKQFWSMIAASSPDVPEHLQNREAVRYIKPVREALAGIVDPDQGGGGTHEERQAILAKAWGIFKEDCDILKASLDLKYDINREPDTGLVLSRKLLECPIFSDHPTGIDRGFTVWIPKAQSTGTTTKEEIEKAKAELRSKADQKLEDKLKAAATNQRQQAQGSGRRQLLAGVKASQPGKLLLFATEHHVGDLERAYQVYDTDAEIIARTLGIPTHTIDKSDRMSTCTVLKEGIAESLKKIKAAHPNTVIVTRPTVPLGQEAKFCFSEIQG